MLHERISVITPYVEPYVHYFQWKLFVLVKFIILIYFIVFKDQLKLISKYLSRPCVNQI